MMEIATDNSMKVMLSSKITEEQQIISENTTQLNKLKRYAGAQAKLAAKKINFLKRESWKNMTLPEGHLQL